MANTTDTKIPKRKAVQSKYSQPVIPYEMVLNSDFAQRLFERSADVVATSYFHLDTIMPNAYPEKEREINDLEKVVDEELNKVFNDLNDEIARLKVLADNSEVEVGGKDSPAYTKKQHEIIQISTPKYSRYVKLIELFDNFVLHVDTLWLHGIISQSQRRSQTQNWQGRILKIANRTIDRQKRLRASLMANRKDGIDDFEDEADEQSTATKTAESNKEESLSSIEE